MQDDIDAAQEELINRLMREAEQELKDSLNADELFVPEAVKRDVVEKNADVEPNTTTNSFNVTAKVRVATSSLLTNLTLIKLSLIWVF